MKHLIMVNFLIFFIVLQGGKKNPPRSKTLGQAVEHLMPHVCAGVWKVLLIQEHWFPPNKELILSKIFVRLCPLWYLPARGTRYVKHNMLDLSHLSADVLQSFPPLSWHFSALKLLSSLPPSLPSSLSSFPAPLQHGLHPPPPFSGLLPV